MYQRPSHHGEMYSRSSPAGASPLTPGRVIYSRPTPSVVSVKPAEDPTQSAMKLAEARAIAAEAKVKLLEEQLAKSVKPDERGTDATKPDRPELPKPTSFLEVPLPKPEIVTSMQVGSGTKIGQMSNEELEQDYDLVVIGGGPAGVSGALQAATLGRRTLLVDKPKAPPIDSGLDLFFGAPTGLFSKALRECGKKIDVQTMKAQGLFDNVIWGQVQGMCLNMASMNAEKQVEHLQKFKVGYLQAQATIVAPNKVLVQRQNGEHTIVTTAKILVATGSKPLRPPGIPFDGKSVFDSDTVNTLNFLPEHVVVLGGGIISIEYARIFRKLGARVTMLIRGTAKESLQRIGTDRDVCDELISSLRKAEVTIYEDTSVAKYNLPANKGEKVHLDLESKDKSIPSTCNCDIVLVAFGRKASVTGFGLEKLEAKLAKPGYLVVDDNFQTSVKGIYAAGDSIGPPSLASTSVHQAKGAVLSMFDEGEYETPTNFPVGIWTTPECSWYGLTKEAAEKKGMKVTEGMARYTQCLRGRVFSPEGLVKLVFLTDCGTIVGVHLIGTDACELVHYGMDLVDQKVTIFKLISTLFTAVTYHELFKEAALDGNSKLAFGAAWQSILKELGSVLGADGTGEYAQVDKELLKEEFNLMDESGDGSLDADELTEVFRRLGTEPKKSTIMNLVRLADTDGNGTIEWEEFEQIFEVINAASGGRFSRQVSRAR